MFTVDNEFPARWRAVDMTCGVLDVFSPGQVAVRTLRTVGYDPPSAAWDDSSLLPALLQWADDQPARPGSVAAVGMDRLRERAERAERMHELAEQQLKVVKTHHIRRVDRLKTRIADLNDEVDRLRRQLDKVEGGTVVTDQAAGPVEGATECARGCTYGQCDPRAPCGGCCGCVGDCLIEADETPAAEPTRGPTGWRLSLIVPNYLPKDDHEATLNHLLEYAERHGLSLESEPAYSSGESVE